MKLNPLRTSVKHQIIKWTCSIITLILPINALSNSWNTDSDWEEYVQSIIQDDEHEADATTLFEELSYIRQNPINLNNTNKQELERLPFLSDRQIEKILSYIYINYPMYSLYELQLVEEIDRQTIRLLLPFVYIGKRTPDESTKWNTKFGKSNLLLRTDLSLSPKQGYAPTIKDETTQPRKYVGSPLYQQIKYEWGNSKFIKTGIIMEKDAGEDYRSVADYLSMHLQIDNLGIIKRLIVGDYKVTFGQGLIINQGFSMGKSYFTSAAGQRTSGIARYFSTDENRASRGAALTLKLPTGELSLWGSFRTIDARLTNDTLLSFPTGGLHRTTTELATRNQAYSWNSGVNYSLFIKTLRLGITSVLYGWNKPYFREARYYNTHLYRGSINGQIGLDYRWHHPMITCFGETAYSPNRDVATLNGITVNPTSGSTITLLHRYYGKRYDAYYAQAFANSSTPNAEHGIYLSLTLRPLSELLLSGYVDMYENLTAKYLINIPTNGAEIHSSALYSISKRWDIGIKFRYKEGWRNYTDELLPTKQITPTRSKTLRLFAHYNTPNHITTKTSLSYSHYKHAPSSPTQGIGFSQTLSIRLKRSIFMDASAAYIDTDDYYASVYVDEKSMLYSFASNRYSGNLFRGALTMRYSGQRMSVWVKYSASHYFDRSIIGEGAETISTPLKHSIQTLIRLKF